MKLKSALVLGLLFFVGAVYAEVLIYSHRGGRGLWPENTLCAYKKSLALGIDFVDMDVQLSKDGVLMVTHDEALNPDLTRDEMGNWLNDTLLISELTAAQIKKYNVGQLKSNTEYAKRFRSQKGKPLLRIPTLTETIKFVKKHQHRSTGFQIEVKSASSQLKEPLFPMKIAKTLHKAIVDNHISNIVEVQSFDFRVLMALYQLAPKIKLAYLTDSNHSPNEWWAGNELKNNQHVSTLVKTLHGSLWEPSAAEITLDEIKKAHQQGLKVVVWGMPANASEEEKLAGELIAAGVDGIITDRPDLYANYLKVNDGSAGQDHQNVLKSIDL